MVSKSFIYPMLCFLSLTAMFEGFLKTSATTFVPVPISTLLKESYGVIHGHFLKKVYKKLSTGEVVTVASFRLDQAAGIRPNEMLNPNEFKVMYRGGIWQGLVYKVYGAPDFAPNEEVVLLVNKKEDGFWVHNLALGKFKIMRKKGKVTLVSEVYPNHPKFGEVDFQDFQDSVREQIGQEIESIKKEQEIVFKGKQESGKENLGRSTGRSVASANDFQQDKLIDDSSQSNNWWPVIILGILGSFSYLISRKSNF